MFPHPKDVFLATGTNYPDALTGAVYASYDHAPLALVHPTCIPVPLERQLSATPTGHVALLGGLPSLSANVAALGPC